MMPKLHTDPYYQPHIDEMLGLKKSFFCLFFNYGLVKLSFKIFAKKYLTIFINNINFHQS